MRTLILLGCEGVFWSWLFTVPPRDISLVVKRLKFVTSVICCGAPWLICLKCMWFESLIAICN